MNPSATSKITKDQLWQENDYLKSFFMTMDEGLIITDSSGIIQKINTAMTEILGYTEAELIGKHAMFLAPETYPIGEKPASIVKLLKKVSMKNIEGRYKSYLREVRGISNMPHG